jgi:hypothetical protein
MANNRIVNNLPRDLFVLEDENNPRSSKVDQIYPSTILDQVFDDQTATNKNLRQILADLKIDILTGGQSTIVFPVTSVNNQQGDVTLAAKDVGLGRVDNTADIDKPLSGPQQQAVNNMISNYDFKVNLEELYNHINNTNNPHSVTLDQLDINNVVSDTISDLIAKHNYSTADTTHTDIRRNLVKLWDLVDEINNTLDDRVSSVLDTMDNHMDDNNAHYDIFKTKENLSNKVSAFSDSENNDSSHYPSTRAVVEYVENRITSYDSTAQHISDWIDDIQVVEDLVDLPRASAKYYRKAYFVRKTHDSYNAVAICRLNQDGTYSWDISNMGVYSKFDNKYFNDSTDGMSLNMVNIVKDILNTNGSLDTAFNELIKGYCTKEYLASFNYVTAIKILPGTVNGSIKYYINNDLTTISDDIRIPGLKTLAYLDYVTENEIWDNSVWSHHIKSDSIETRHIQDKAVIPDKIKCEWGTVIGNTEDETGQMSHEIKLQELADYLRPLIGGWPDPNTPGGNIYYDTIMDYTIHPQRLDPGFETSLLDNSYIMRFYGIITYLPNSQSREKISDMINSSTCRIIQAGGSWEYQSDPSEWSILAGSNITGHTYATVTLKADGLYFESMSIGDRKDAVYDIWVRYTKVSEVNPVPNNIYYDSVAQVTDSSVDPTTYFKEYEDKNLNP